MKTVAIIQARVGSSRLPGKVLLPLAGKCSLDWCITRILGAKCVDEICVATTTAPQDNAIVYHMGKWATVAILRGPENDVMGRTLEAAKKTGADIIVDVTSDCPMVDPGHINYLHRTLLNFDMDYVSNVMERSWPDGLDVQIYRTAAFEKLSEPKTRVHHGYIGYEVVKEHSGWNFIGHKDNFRTLNWEAPEEMNHPEWRWTLDTPEDWRRLNRIINSMVASYGEAYHTEDVPEAMYLKNKSPEEIGRLMGC